MSRPHSPGGEPAESEATGARTSPARTARMSVDDSGHGGRRHRRWLTTGILGLATTRWSSRSSLPVRLPEHFSSTDRHQPFNSRSCKISPKRSRSRTSTIGRWSSTFGHPGAHRVAVKPTPSSVLIKLSEIGSCSSELTIKTERSPRSTSSTSSTSRTCPATTPRVSSRRATGSLGSPRRSSSTRMAKSSNASPGPLMRLAYELVSTTCSLYQEAPRRARTGRTLNATGQEAGRLDSDR